MTVYLVIQQGVYRHNIVGAYDTLDAAKARAVEALLHEPDQYHEYCVERAELNTPLDDVRLVHTVKREWVVESKGKEERVVWAP